MTKEEAIVLPFYTGALTVNAETRPTRVLAELLADDFESIDSHERKNKETLIKQVEFFWKLIPDLKWTPEDVIVAGDKVVVRSVATGSPKGAFMGLALDGSRSFRIDTTDIHELAGSRIQRVRHLEGWAPALKQLAPRPDHCIETATFRLNPGVTDEQMLAVERRVRAGRIAQMPGFISRELAKDAHGNTWLVVLRFATRPQLEAWLAEVKSVPEMRELGSLIDRDSLKSSSFTRGE
jgi:predicted ester cyclase